MNSDLKLKKFKELNEELEKTIKSRQENNNKINSISDELNKLQVEIFAESQDLKDTIWTLDTFFSKGESLTLHAKYKSLPETVQKLATSYHCGFSLHGYGVKLRFDDNDVRLTFENKVSFNKFIEQHKLTVNTSEVEIELKRSQNKAEQLQQLLDMAKN